MQLSGLSEHEIEAFHKRLAKTGQSKQDFEATCRRVCDEFYAMKEAREAREEFKSIIVEKCKRSECRMGVFLRRNLRRFLGWLRRILVKDTKKTRMDIVLKQFFDDDPSSNEQFLSDTNLNYVMLGIMHDTHPKNIVIMPGESEEDAVRRITQRHLQDHKKALEDFAETCPDLPNNLYREWEAEVRQGLVDDLDHPEDPLLSYVRQSKLKEALSKEDPDAMDRKVIDEALSKSKNDIIVLE